VYDLTSDVDSIASCITKHYFCCPTNYGTRTKSIATSQTQKKKASQTSETDEQQKIKLETV